MFTIDDFLKMINFLYSGTDDPITPLSPLTKSLIVSEKNIVTNYFENILDQPTFSTDDYKRLRNFFIDWYSSHRTIATTQKNVSDVHSLPNDHLSELFKSFGFPIGLNLVPLTAKANLFLDLVNFYKRKGTPETLVDVLEYYGFSDADLVEYWVVQDSIGEFVFRGHSVRTSGSGGSDLLEMDLGWNSLTLLDPHWMLRYEDMQNLVDNNKINLPSKSPYFSLSSIFFLDKLVPIMAIISRIVQDQYDYGVLNGFENLPKDLVIKNIGETVSLLELYISTIYVFENQYGPLPGGFGDRCSHYNGFINYHGTPPYPSDLYPIITEYENLVSRTSKRSEIQSKKDELYNNWTTDKVNNFLISGGYNTARDLLISINPDLKSVIDIWISSGETNSLLTYLVGTIDIWIKRTIYTGAPSLVITLLGLSFRDEIIDIINFFKPMRARLAFLDTRYAISNPVKDGIILSDGDETGSNGSASVSIETEDTIIDNVEIEDNFQVYLVLTESDRVGRLGFKGGYFESSRFDGLPGNISSYENIHDKTVDFDKNILNDVFYSFDEGGQFDRLYPIGDAMTIQIIDT